MRDRVVLELRHLEAGGADRLERRAVAVAALRDAAVDRQHPVLEPRELRVVGADVLHEEQAAARAQHAAQFAQRPWLVVDGAEHERRDRGVEAVVGERQVLGRRAQEARLRRVLGDPRLDALRHRLLGLGDREAGDAGPVVGQVCARPAADLDHVAARLGEERGPVRGKAVALGPRQETVVRRREETSIDAHAATVGAGGRTVVRRLPHLVLMAISYPGESAQYRAERDRLLERELRLRHEIEAVAAQRRALPPGGPIPEDYAFHGAEDEVRFSELFVPGLDSLVLYSFMFPRDPADDRPGERDGPCASCVALLDQLDGTTYNRDYLAETAEGHQRPMLNVFHRDGDAIRHFWGSELFYAPAEPGQDPRHVGTLEPSWNMFDLTPDGRDAGWDEQLRYD